MILMKNLLVTLILMSGIQVVLAQTTTKKDDESTSIYTQQQAQEKKEAAMDNLIMQNSILNRKSAEQPLTKAELKNEEKRIKTIIAPYPQDLAKYNIFLSQPDAGVFRLFPDFNCESKGLIRLDGECKNFIPGASTFSFRQRDHQLLKTSKFFDIKLNGDTITCNELLSQGILTTLGDIPLESVSLDNKGLNFLRDFVPATENTEVKMQFIQISNGINFDGYNYVKAVKAEENITYALRVVAYKIPFRLRYRNDLTDPRIRDLAAGRMDEKRIDLTLAFRIVRKETDGNITIVWKELRRQKSPELQL